MRPFALPSPTTTILCACLAWACATVPSRAQEEAPAPTVVKAPDGVEIAYRDSGAGEVALVMIHCWACNQEFWREQVAAFDGEYRVVTLDLPGHGASGRNRDGWSVAGYAQDVQAVVEALDLPRVILVGHSMGGPVALAACPLIADRVLGVLAVETLHDVEMEFPEEAVEAWAKTLEADYPGTMRMMVEGMFGDPEQTGLRDWIIEQALANDEKAMVALIRSYDSVDTKSWMAAAKVPVRAVNAAPRPPVIPETKTESNRRHGDFDAVLMDGVGHYLLLEKPEAFNALMRAELEEILAASE